MVDLPNNHGSFIPLFNIALIFDNKLIKYEEYIFITEALNRYGTDHIDQDCRFQHFDLASASNIECPSEQWSFHIYQFIMKYDKVVYHPRPYKGQISLIRFIYSLCKNYHDFMFL